MFWNARGTGSSSQLAKGLILLSLVVLLFGAGFGSGAAVMWLVGPQLRAHAAIESAVAETVADDTVVEEDEGLDIEQSVKLLFEVWNILDREYIEPSDLKSDKLTYGAARGMVDAVGDAHTAFVEPVTAKIMQDDMQGEFEGIGATVNVIDGQLVIVEPMPGSPAEEAGILAGDIVLAVDGESLDGVDALDAISMIRGPRGSVVRLLIQREGVDEPFVVPVTRDTVELVTVESEMLEGDIGYVRLDEFNAVSADHVHEALDGLLDQGASGIVFDLRGNPGGYLHMAVEVASEFLPEGSVVLSEKERGKETTVYSVETKGLATDIPLVVLVNGGSASASEIVAGAVRDNDRGVLIGETTYGKGSVQNTHELSDASSLRVTVARWYLPNGDNLDGNGIEPDITVVADSEEVAAGVDAQLDRAVSYLLNGE